MIYPARGKKQLVVLSSIAGAVALGIAALLIAAAVSAGHPVLAIVLAVVLVPAFLWIFFGKTQRDLQHWQYEIQGTDLVVNLPRARRTIPISCITKVTRAQGNTRMWWGDALQVGYVPGTEVCPVLLNPEDPDGMLRGLAEADPGLHYDGQQVSRAA